MIGNNELIPMTRRYPNLKQKVLLRDSKIASKLIVAWDVHQDRVKVLEIFVKECKNLSDERYWELLRTVWIITGGIEYDALFRKLMKSTRSQRHYFSTPEESKKLREMPEVFDIFRTSNKLDDNGLSWTLSKKYAEWYQKAYCKSHLFMRTIKKEDVFAYINRNNEEEIIIL